MIAVSVTHSRCFESDRVAVLRNETAGCARPVQVVVYKVVKRGLSLKCVGVTQDWEAIQWCFNGQLEPGLYMRQNYLQ